MRLLIQRVCWARVRVNRITVAEIGPGMTVFVGVGRDDKDADAYACARNVAVLRIFGDAAGKMNRHIRQTGGSVLSVSQFTLYACMRDGTRPGFDRAAGREVAERLWCLFNDAVRRQGVSVREGLFAADMAVELCNDGPVTIGYDSQE